MLKISLLQFDVFVNLYIETPVTLNQYNLFTYKGKTTTGGGTNFRLVAHSKLHLLQKSFIKKVE